MRKRTRFLLLCCLSFLAGLSGNAQNIEPPREDVVATDTIESELYTSVKARTTTYYDLGCKHQGLQGYFAPERWYKTADFGDGGVDVTEAPNAKVVEGATGARLIVQTDSSDVCTWRITIPADGYLFFRLEKVGSFLSQRISSTDTGLQLVYNNEVSDYAPLANGGYYSQHLKAGDTFGIIFRGKKQKFEWEDFTFYSNCVGVEIVDAGGKDPVSGIWRAARVKPIHRATMDQVYFTSQLSEVWPVVDQDGDLFTVDDQLILTDDTLEQLPFELIYKDHLMVFEGQYWKVRRFIVREPCSGNTMSVERRWQPLPLLGNLAEEDIR